MKIMLLHPAAPGQFSKLLMHYLSNEENEVAILHMGSRELVDNPHARNSRCRQFDLRQMASLDENQKPYLRHLDKFIRSATAAAHVANSLREENWSADLIYSHTGFGLGAFVHNVFPDAVYVKYCEWHYRNAPDGAEFFSGVRAVDSRVGTELLNAPILLDLMRADVMIAPTEWQRRQFPKHLRQSIAVIPDGIDTNLAKPDPLGLFTAPNGRAFRKGDRVVTYVGRGADPFRGFEQFIRALERLQARDPAVEAIVVGDKLVHYGPMQGTQSHFDSVIAESALDMSRTHFTGSIPYSEFIKVLQVSAVHVYLTAPFVLSWSALEAMACGCAIVASDNAPVREFIEDGVHGLLAEFDDPQEIADKVALMLNDEALRLACGEKARECIISRWDLEQSLERHLDIVHSALNRRPSVTIARKT